MTPMTPMTRFAFTLAALIIFPSVVAARKPSPAAEEIRRLTSHERKARTAVTRAKRRLGKRRNPVLARKLAAARTAYADLHYRLGTLYKSVGNTRAMEKRFLASVQLARNILSARSIKSQDFYRTHPAEKKVAFRAIEALHLVAAAYWYRADLPRARACDKKTVAFFARFHLPKGKKPAAARAAEAAYRQSNALHNKALQRVIRPGPIPLQNQFGNRPHHVIALSCELMGWGISRRTRKPCKGKAVQVLLHNVNAYVSSTQAAALDLLKQVHLSHLHPTWSLAAHKRAATIYALAAARLRALPLPSETRRFWGIYWNFVQKYKTNPRLAAVFNRVLGNYGSSIHTPNVNALIRNYRRTFYKFVFANAAAMASEAARLRKWRP